MRIFRESGSVLGIVAAALLAVHAWRSLPARVPTHFDLAGHPNGWGSPHVFVFFPAIALGIWTLLTVIARFPQTFNYPIEVGPEVRARLAPVTKDLIGWIKLEIVWTFVLTTWLTIRAAENGHPGMTFWMVFASFLFVLATVWIYMKRMRRVA